VHPAAILASSLRRKARSRIEYNSDVTAYSCISHKRLTFVSPTFYGEILVPGYMYTTGGPSTKIRQRLIHYTERNGTHTRGRAADNDVRSRGRKMMRRKVAPFRIEQIRGKK